MHKKWIIVLSAVIMVVALVTAAFASGSPVKLIVNGKEIEPDDVLPRIIDGRLMVPIGTVARALNAEVNWDKENNTVDINYYHAVAATPEGTVKLYPFKEDNGMYDGFILEVGEKRHYFDWKTSNSPSSAPQLFLNDINQDGKPEIIVILTMGRGTGVYIGEIHVINPNNFAEVNVENPLDAIKQRVRTEINQAGKEVIITVSTDDKTTIIKKDKEYAAVWLDNVYFGNVIYYRVIENQLVVEAAAQVSCAGFVGEMKIGYIFDGNKYRAESIEFKPYPDKEV